MRATITPARKVPSRATNVLRKLSARPLRTAVPSASASGRPREASPGGPSTADATADSSGKVVAFGEQWRNCRGGLTKPPSIRPKLVPLTARATGQGLLQPITAETG